MNAVFIKLGGSLITDKATPKRALKKRIKAIAKEIATIHKSHPETVFFIGNGAGSYGHFAVHETRWREKKNDPMRIAKIRQVTTELHYLIRDALIAENVPALSFAATSFSGRFNQQPKAWLESMFAYATHGSVPLVFGDMVYDDQDGAYVLSTEEILETIAKSWKNEGHTIDTFIYCTSVDGVLDEDGNVIDAITTDTPIASIGKTHGFDVTGGMAQKIEAGKRALAFTNYVYIINGSTPGTLTRAVQHEAVGTRIKV
jgi:isopentenyl phosphate kinase